MLRAGIMCVALSVLVEACALVEQPVPAGTRPILVRLDIRLSDPVEITIKTPLGVLPGAVQPTTRVNASAMADLTFHVPLKGTWVMANNGTEMISSFEFNALEEGCLVIVSLRTTGWGYQCENPR